MPLTAPFKRPIAGARRALMAAAAALALAISVASIAPAARAGIPGCAWQPLTLENGWQSQQTAYTTGDPSYCVGSDGMVYLSGSLARPAGNSFGILGVLPSSAAPAHYEFMSVYTYNGTPGVLEVGTDGSLRAFDGNASQFTSLAGVSFPAASAATVGLMPLLNGWQSAQSTWGTGDPAYFISNGAVHLDGSVLNPTPPQPYSEGWTFAQLPSQAQPPAACFERDVYTDGGGTGPIATNTWTGTLYAPNAEFTSLAGVSYPVPSATWQPLNGGTEYGPCVTPSDSIIGGVVYLTGYYQFNAGFSGQFAVLPPGARPTHYLYLTVFGDGADGNQWVTLRIDPDGAMSVFNGDPQGFSVFLTGISYHANS